MEKVEGSARGEDAKALLLLGFVGAAEPHAFSLVDAERVVVGFLLHGPPPIEVQVSGPALLDKSDEGIDREQAEIEQAMAEYDDETSPSYGKGLHEMARWVDVLTENGLCTLDRDGLRLTARGRAEIAVLKAPGTKGRPNAT